MKKAITMLLVKALVLGGVVRIGFAAFDSLTEITEIVRASKDLTWVPQREEDMETSTANTEAHLSKSFILNRKTEDKRP